MIKLIQSPRLKLPIVYLAETYNDVKSLPLGIPFIRASIKDYSKCVQMLEWDVLWKSAMATKLPFNWEELLRKHGYKTWKYGVARSSHDALIGESGESSFEDLEDTELDTVLHTIDSSTFLSEISYKVDVDVLKELKLLPIWLEDIENAVKENITNSIVYNPSLYTKKLDLPLGGVEYSPGMKNVIIIDISSSIPSGVSKTMLALSKTLAEQFYADLVITGSRSTLYEYDRLDLLDIDSIYSKNGMDNDQVWFRKLVEEPRKYKTALVFGDNHYPGQTWSNSYNKKTRYITEEDGQKLCKWEVSDILSFHTTSKTNIAGYARWFNTEKITHIDNWVKDLNK